MPSFLDCSFDPSDNQLNVFEAKGEQSKQNDEHGEEEGEQKEENVSYEEPKSTEDEG